MFVIVLLTMLAYGLIHSWLASTHLKQVLRQRVGDQKYHGFYRALYNVLAVVTLAPIFGLIVFRPGNILWQITGFGQFLLVMLQIVGLIGMILSLFQINLGRFIGLSQAAAYLQEKKLPLPEEALQYGGVYQLVRHPLYLFSLLVIWPMSTMTESLLAFNIGATIYFLIGSILEERKLANAYGEEYRQYQKRIPAIIPRIVRLREH